VERGRQLRLRANLHACVPVCGCLRDYKGDLIENEVGGACGTCGGKTIAHRMMVGKLEGTRLFGKTYASVRG
jgi:hypothetical protein